MEEQKKRKTKKASTKRAWRIGLICTVLAASAIIAFLLPLLTASQIEALPPSMALAQRAQALDDIEITAVFSPEERTLRVRQCFDMTLPEGESRSAVVFRAYPNAFQSEATSPIATEELHEISYPNGFSGGALTITSVSVGRIGEELQAIRHRYLDDAKTVLQLSLPAPWEPLSTLTTVFEYEIYVPKAASRFGVHSGIWALGNAFLIPAPFENGAYRTDPYEPIGDPFLSDCANYTVTIDVPEGYICAGSGWPLASSPSAGMTRFSFEALAVRDFALCISDRYQAVQAMENGTLITVYTHADSTAPNAAKEALRYAKQAIAHFSKTYGTYPYPSLTIVEVDFPFDGAEYPALVMLGSGQLAAGGDALEWTMAHETAHQWWYAVVGNDPIHQAWQDEALCEYSALSYMEAFYGRARREDLLFERMETAMRITIPRGATPGSPLHYFSSIEEYYLLVYQRGGAMLATIDEALFGKLDNFLRKYYDDYWCRRATREDFEALLAAFSGEDWRPLMQDYLDTYVKN